MEKKQANKTRWWGFLLLIPLLLVFMGLLFEKNEWSRSPGKVEELVRNQYSGEIKGPEPYSIQEGEPWPMHLIDSKPSSGSDGVKLADVNGDGLPDLATGFEEGGVSRIYLNPGKENVRNHWEYVELPSSDVEDAVLIDLDNNGIFDLVTASEGSTNQIIFHWAPDQPNEYLDASKWQTQILPVTEGMSAWMFVVPFNLDGDDRVDLIVGSKRIKGAKGNDKAVTGWLKAPENPRDINNWRFFPLTKAGWIMSIALVDMNNDNKVDILISDRKFSSQTGVRWLENPGKEKKAFYSEWKSNMVGVGDGEPMFLTLADLNGDGLDEILVPDLSEGLKIFEQTPASDKRWKSHTVPFPDWAGTRGKAVAVADIDLDGNSDVVLSFEEGGNVASIPYKEYRKNGKYSVIWGSFKGDFTGNWEFYKVSGLKGRKFDLVNLIDLDGDGDLDVLTNDENEEDEGLGVIWYENPVR